MKKTNELFISLGWEVISVVLWTEGLLNSALDFYLFSLLSLSLSSLSLPSSAYEQRGVYTTHREIIDPWRNHWRIVRGWLIPRRWLPGQWLLLRGNLCCFSLFLCLICVLKQGFFVYWYNPPPPLLSPKMCVYLPIQTRLFCVLKVFG